MPISQEVIDRLILTIRKMENEARPYHLRLFWTDIMRFPQAMIEDVTLDGIGGYLAVKDKSPWR